MGGTPIQKQDKTLLETNNQLINMEELKGKTTKCKTSGQEISTVITLGTW